jgi:hypothetical protein
MTALDYVLRKKAIDPLRTQGPTSVVYVSPDNSYIADIDGVDYECITTRS